jgi:mRNA-degrading endonuclease toxin of MazEF toxin-antitoxin module
MADQLATVSKPRLTRRIGVLTADQMQRAGQAIKVHLDLD